MSPSGGHSHPCRATHVLENGDAAVVLVRLAARLFRHARERVPVPRLLRACAGGPADKGRAM